MCRYIFKVGTRVINLHGICVFKFLTATLLKNLRRIRHCVPVMCVNNYNRPTKSCARNISIFNTVIYFGNFIFPYRSEDKVSQMRILLMMIFLRTLNHLRLHVNFKNTFKLSLHTFELQRFYFWNIGVSIFGN